METQKIVNLLNGTDNENSKLATKKWYIIDSKTRGAYSPNNEIKFLTNSFENKVFMIIIRVFELLEIILLQVVMQIQKLHLKIMHHLQNAK